MPLEYALQFRGRFPDSGPWKLPRSLAVRPSQPLGVEFRPRKGKENPFVYNLMVAGESGLGKTTFLNTLFNSDLYQIHPRSSPTLQVDATTFDVDEEGVRLHLTVVDTPGFGDALDRSTKYPCLI